jgi:hypothetical protein
MPRRRCMPRQQMPPRAATRRHAAITYIGRRRRSNLSYLLPAPRLWLQLQAGYRLMRATPGLSTYMCGGLCVWLTTRVLITHGLASSAWGFFAVGTLRLLGLCAVVALYFRRTGQLAEARATLARLLTAVQRPARQKPRRAHQQWLRVVGWVLGTERGDADKHD